MINMLLFLLIGTVVLTGLLLAIYIYVVANNESFFGFLESLSPGGTEQLTYYGNVFAYFIVGLIILFFVVIIFRIFRRASKKHKRLRDFGLRTFCKVYEIKIVKLTDDRGKVYEYKDAYIKTPLGKGGVYRFPISENIEEDDSLLILYDPENPEFFNLAYEKGKHVVKKTNQLTSKFGERT